MHGNPVQMEVFLQ